jgi:glycerol kinase
MERKKSYILAIDQSTSGTKILLFDQDARPVNRITLEHRQYYPQPGFVEHDPEEIFENTLKGIRQLVKQHPVRVPEIACLSITNQRETAIIWERSSGKPVARAAVWQCQRGVPFCKQLKAGGHEGMIRSRTGLLIDSYFSASKLHWLMEHTPGIREKAEEGELLLGTMDSWLLWKLTAGRVHATDYSNACRTMLFNIHTLQWDHELIELFGLHRSMFPDVHFSDEIFGYTESGLPFDQPVPVAGIMGDSHAALFGQQCVEPGMGKATYGTGSSVMMNTGFAPLEAPEGLVNSIGYGMDKQIHYVFEGNIHATGDTLNWLKNELQLIREVSETEELAAGIDNNHGVYLVPAFMGLGAPYWDSRARASITGMSRDTTKAHVVRAALESIAYQIRDLITLMEGQGKIRLKELRADGGPTRNQFLMQFQADILKRKVICSEIEEVSALGAAFMGGLATGFWKNLEEIESLRQNARTYEPAMDEKEVEKLYAGWIKAVERTRL